MGGGGLEAISNEEVSYNKVCRIFATLLNAQSETGLVWKSVLASFCWGYDYSHPLPKYVRMKQLIPLVGSYIHVPGLPRVNSVCVYLVWNGYVILLTGFTCFETLWVINHVQLTPETPEARVHVRARALSETRELREVLVKCRQNVASLVTSRKYLRKIRVVK